MSDDRPAPAGIVRFGVFELDLRSEDLRRRGVRVPLQHQPFRMLVRLLERPGELVTREALRQELWPADTFVDFEQGLNAVVRRLRDALGDSAETPRFIETLPKRGYRFLAPVHSDGAPPASGVDHRRRVIAWLVAGALLAVGAAVTGWRALRPPPLSETDLIVLGDFDNQTTEAVLTGTMKHALAVKLAESHFINVLSEERVRDVLRSMRRRPDEILTPAVAREVCQRSRAKATVTGAVASLGSAYVISLNAEACSTGEYLVRDQVQAAGKELILTALDGMAARLRRRLGESLRAVNAANTPLESGTTSSLDALKAFTEGERRFSTGAQAAAMPFYRRAIELDPDFALAHAKLGVACFNLSVPCGVAELAKAFELRDRLSEREQFYVTAQYYRLAEGDLEASRPVYEVWKAAYPRDPVPYTSLGLLFTRQGQLDRAVTEFEGAAAVAPMGHAFSNLLDAYLQTSRVADARRVLEAWERADGVPVHHARFLLAFLQRDASALETEGAAVGDGPDGLDMQADRARAVAFFGKLQRARKLFSLAETGRVGADFAQASILLKLDQAVLEAEVGNQRLARERVSEVWPLRGGTYEQFLSLWQDGDPDVPVLDAARREYDRLRQPESTGTRGGSRSE